MKKKLYRIEDFHDFILANDYDVRILGWTMIINSFKLDGLSLKELCLLKIRATDNKYSFKEDRKYYWQLVAYRDIEERNTFIANLDITIRKFDNKLIKSTFDKTIIELKEEKKRIKHERKLQIK